ncbi:MAG: FAD-dependent oxidoreductase [Candidatus Aminicenantes bacterium]|nr:FAD-dependent oxidoreductase [Candidatus Aminicenantes bacterium]
MGELTNTADVVIIGGGIVGASTAFHLAEQGQKNVVLCERDLLAQASTGLCVGGIRQQFSHPANILLSQEVVRLFERFEEEFGVDIQFRQAGYIFLAQHSDTWEDVKTSVQIQHKYGVPVELLPPEEIKSRWAYLEVNDLEGGTFCPEDGYADPYLVTMAFANAARRLGVHIREQTHVTAISVEHGRIRGVSTTQGPISAPIIVNTAGAWGGEIARMAGLKIPVKPYRRQVFATKAFDLIPRPVPMVIDLDSLFYFRGEDPCIILGMSDREETSSFNTHVDRAFLERVIEAAVYRAPVLEKAEILRGWGGLYAITPDENPIIGVIPEIEGFLCAVGFSGHGFQHGPAVGRILAELICKGQTDFDLTPFAHDRFGKIRGKSERRAI